MKMKRHEVIGLNNILSIEGFKTSEMNNDNSFNIILLKNKASEIASSADKIRTDFAKVNSTKELEELSKKEEKNLTEKEIKRLNELNRALNDKFVEVYTKHIEEEIEIEFSKFSKEEFKKLMLSNRDNNKIDLNKLSYLCKYLVEDKPVVEEVKAI